MKVMPGGVTTPQGFLSSGIHCGIKFMRKDLALIYSQRPCLAYGVFTQNKVQAAPLKLTKRHLLNNKAQAVIINSGNANCCTGKQGIRDAQIICRSLAKALSIPAKDVLIASTGVIGKRLPLEKITNSIGVLVQKLNAQGGLASAQAIMTTDTKPKQTAVLLKVGKKAVRIGGMAKGAGMIHPHLATMLAFITTDLHIDRNSLKKSLEEAVAQSFNLITVEGDTSTNDMVLILANGLAGNKRLKPGEFQIFQQALNFICLSLAKMIVRDAEGATKFVEIQVCGARNPAQARRVAVKVANSPLVKTALFGENPNWGRIAASVGMADPLVKENKLNLYLGKEKVLQKGMFVKSNTQRLQTILKENDIQIKIVLGLGKSSAKVFTCDLSEKYVRINAEY